MLILDKINNIGQSEKSWWKKNQKIKSVI